MAATTAQLILNMFASKDARKWYASNARPEISGMHFPLGWVPLDFSDALDELVRNGDVSIVELPHRVNARRKVSFVVRNNQPEITGIEIRSADVEWIERTGFDWREDYVTNSRYYLVTVPASAMVNVEHVTFAGRDMVRGTIVGAVPYDHTNPNLLYPFGYAKVRTSVEK